MDWGLLMDFEEGRWLGVNLLFWGGTLCTTMAYIPDVVGQCLLLFIAGIGCLTWICIDVLVS